MIDCVKVQPHLFVFNSATIGVFFALFGPYEDILRARVRLKKFFGTYLCRQTTLVLKVQTYLLFYFDHILGLHCTFLGPSRSFFWSLRAIFGSGSGSKICLEPTNIHYQFLFWKCSPIFLFLNMQNLWPFLHFLGPLGLFLGLGLGSGSKLFLEPTYVDNELWVWNYSPIFFVFNLATF